MAYLLYLPLATSLLPLCRRTTTSDRSRLLTELASTLSFLQLLELNRLPTILGGDCLPHLVLFAVLRRDRISCLEVFSLTPALQDKRMHIRCMVEMRSQRRRPPGVNFNFGAAWACLSTADFPVRKAPMPFLKLPWGLQRGFRVSEANLVYQA